MLAGSCIVKRLALLALLPLLTLPGCYAVTGVDRTEITEIRPGKSRTEIEKLLGSPSQSEAIDGLLLATYGYNRGSSGHTDWGMGMGALIVLTPLPHVAAYAGQRAEIHVLYSKADVVLSVDAIYKLRVYARLQVNAEAGDPEAQYDLSVRSKPPEQAYKWRCLAASGGVAKASAALGRLHQYGADGFRQDLTRSYKWWSLAEQHGHPLASRPLSEVASFLSPDQVAEAEHIAAVWQADDCGPELEQVLEEQVVGEWKSIDYKHKRREYKQHDDDLQKAKCGNAVAQLSVAWDYEQGYRTVRDLRRAYFWYIWAERQGVQVAAERMGHLNARLQLEDRIWVDREIEQWRPIACDIEADEEGHSIEFGLSP